LPRAKPEARTVTCEGCGVPFETTKTNKTFCSKECHTAHRARLREAEREQRQPLVKVCALCGVEYTVGENGSTLRGLASSKYCSVEHRDAANTKARTTKRRTSLGRAVDEDGRVTRKLSPHTVAQLNAVRAILNPDNPISVRSCCYHLLSLGLLESTEDFNNMCKKITAARLRESEDGNFLPDDCFVDHSRVLEFRQGHTSVEDFFELVKNGYSRDPWQSQPLVPIILCEKRGHGDILKNVCGTEQVRLFLSKGIHARSFLCHIAEHVAEIISNGQAVRIGYLGDHDASGLQMEITAENGNAERGVRRSEGLRQILNNKYGLSSPDLTWTRLGLTTEQFLSLPQEARVPVKVKDNNAKAYAARFGNFGGEVEALGFETLQGLVREFIESHKDQGPWEESRRTEQDELRRLAEVTI
jgi:hypothetical protein